MALTDEQIPNTVEYLNLSDNLIHTIGNGTFRSKQFLSSLDLRKNQLSSLELAAYMVDTLTTGHPIRLSVADNPLDCSCEMDWIRNNKDVSITFFFFFFLLAKLISLFNLLFLI